MVLKNNFLLILLLLPSLLSAQPALTLELFASGLSAPVDIAHAGDERIFIVEKAGRIRIVSPDGSVRNTPFLDIDARVNSSASERGLLGLAFHPDYASNGYFFVNYTNNSGDTRISRFSRDAADPNRADPNSEKILLTVDQPLANHNGGDLAFGPDGYLYIGLGDGGGAGDPNNFSQTTSSLLGKMLRIDVNTTDATPYAIPGSNPFVNNPNVRDEIWNTGLRNPWRFSFDRETGDLWIADVGQNQWEEINFQAAGGAGGENYGWRCYEGAATYNSSGCGPAGQYTAPVHVYDHRSGNCSITGGFVYRGSRHPDLQGHYVYADYCSGMISSLTPDGAGGWKDTNLLDWNDFQLVSFGEDAQGELLTAALGQGVIYRVRTMVTDVNAPEQRLAEMTISPNPFRQTLRISGRYEGSGHVDVFIYDLYGRPVFRRREAFSNDFAREYDLSHLAVGVYSLSIVNGNDHRSRRVVKGPS